MPAANLGKSRRPNESAFKQQRLKAWKPLLTPTWVISTFLIVGVVFVPIGVVLLEASNSVKEVRVRYDNACASNCSFDPNFNAGTSCNNLACAITFDVPESMSGPVYMYYELTSFYQNHRRYVKSRDDKQLRGDLFGPGSMQDCEPADGAVVGGTTYALNPCGLVARSVFNDTFTLKSGGTPVTWTNNGIAWSSDKDTKFKNPSSFSSSDVLDGNQFYWLNNLTIPRTGQKIFQDNVESEEFMVWMRTAALPTFRKLHRIIAGGVSAGTYTMEIENNFNVHPFSGEKYFIISTTSWLGGKNDFLGISYIVVGSISLAIGLAFFVKHRISPRKLGDAKYLVWNREP